MKKRLALLFITVLMGLMVFTACGSTENTEQPGNNVSDEKQEEIPAINEKQEEELPATPTPTLSPTPTPEAIQPGRLMLGLSQNMREYGSAEIDLSMVLDMNLDDEQIKMLEDSGYYDGIEIEPVFWLKANGDFASSKDATRATLNMEQNQCGLVSKWSNSEYMQRNTDGDLLEYYFSAADGMWCVYNQGDSTTPDLTEWIEIFGVAQVSQLATMTVFEDIEVTEEGDLYFVDGTISFERFMKITDAVNSLFAGGVSFDSNDLEINVHAEFGKEDKKIQFLSMYLANPKQITQNDMVQFSELRFDVKFNISPDGEKIVVPMDILNSAVSVN